MNVIGHGYGYGQSRQYVNNEAIADDRDGRSNINVVGHLSSFHFGLYPSPARQLLHFYLSFLSSIFVACILLTHLHLTTLNVIYEI